MMTLDRWGMMQWTLVMIAMLFAASEPYATEDDAPVAVVNNHPIPMSYVYQQIESLPLGEQLTIRQQLDRFVESIVREEILFQSMLASNFESEPDLRERIKSIVVEALIERHVSSRISVTERNVRDYFAANTSVIRGEGVRASHILLSERAQCESLIGTIKSTKDFERIAKERSLHRDSALRGGEIGLFMNHTGALGFETELFAMDPGEMRVFDSDDGCHIVRVVSRETPPLPPFEAVAGRIRDLLTAQQEQRLLRQLLERAAAGVSVERVRK